MRYFKILIIFAWAGASSPATPVCAQSNPPFQNPSLDSNCYFPQIGDLSEMDTICGDVAGQELGSIVKNMGTKFGGSFGNMLIGNISSGVALAQVTTGPTFNLHQMKQFIQNLVPDNGSLIGGNGILYDGFHLGHFRDHSHLDMFVPYSRRIYWSDDNGNYDSTQYSVLQANIPPGNDGLAYDLIGTYITHLTSDTIDDIVRSCYSEYYDDNDTGYALLYRGGSTLYGKDTAFEDTSALMYPLLKSTDGAAFRACTQADFRGVGRDDLIVSDNTDNLCYYKNDPPFSLSQFAQAVATDTIFASWQDPHIIINIHGAIKTWFTMRALPKQPGDNSVDFMPVFQTNDDRNNGIFIFSGGPNFGSHRITLDSAAFIIRSPAMSGLGSGYLWPYSIADAGDMTGTGNRVLYTAGGYDNDNQTDNFFVTGKALDDKIDIYNVSNSGSQGDTLTANDDSL
jgi:hypothetical protein